MKDHGECRDETQLEPSHERSSNYHPINEVVNSVSDQADISESMDFAFFLVAVPPMEKLDGKKTMMPKMTK